MVALIALLGAAPVASVSAQTGWRDRNPSTPAAVRSITRSSGRLVGGRARGQVEAWASGDGGATWKQSGIVEEAKPGVVYGDGGFLSDGGREVYCAFREHVGVEWRVMVCRSADGGVTWAEDSVVARTTSGRFVGAPGLWFSRDGDLQCYYDDEETPAKAGHPGSQWISMASRPRRANGKAWRASVVASRPADPARLSRDGMASVCNLNGRDMMLVCEGVDPDKPSVNCLFSIRSHDNGKTWDYASRRVIWAPVKNGVTFNAYCPSAVRTAAGPVTVAFCTDDDMRAPSPDNAPPGRRHAHVKTIQTLGSFDVWGALETVDASQDTMYAPGLFEVSPNDLICTVDLLSGGKQSVRAIGPISGD